MPDPLAFSAPPAVPGALPRPHTPAPPRLGSFGCSWFRWRSESGMRHSPGAGPPGRNSPPGAPGYPPAGREFPRRTFPPFRGSGPQSAAGNPWPHQSPPAAIAAIGAAPSGPAWAEPRWAGGIRRFFRQSRSPCGGRSLCETAAVMSAAPHFPGHSPQSTAP